MGDRAIFVENDDGVHLEWGEFTLCGDSFDIGSTEGDDYSDYAPTTKRTVTCPKCAAMILACRGVRVAVES